jgi:hypothetical protein
MTLALLEELFMALRANDADGYKSWLALGIFLQKVHLKKLL